MQIPILNYKYNLFKKTFFLFVKTTRCAQKTLPNPKGGLNSAPIQANFTTVSGHSQCSKTAEFKPPFFFGTDVFARGKNCLIETTVLSGEIQQMKTRYIRFILLLILLTPALLGGCTGALTQIDGEQVFFAFDSAEISKDAKKHLDSQAIYMKTHPDIDVTIQGRCDERGTTEYNLALGAFRAGNAAHVLTANGIEPERIKTVSYGKENPIYPGTGERIWALNRNATTVVNVYMP